MKRISETAKTCSICSEEFDKSLNTNHNVRDHCHRTGNYREAPHSTCNINYFNNRYLHVVCRILIGWDSHKLLRRLSMYVKEAVK